MKIKKNSLFIILLYFIILVICNIISLNNFFDDDLVSLKALGIICLIELIAFIICNKIITKKVLNFAVVFILVLFLFNFGQLMIYTFLKGIYSHVRFLLLLNNKESLYGFRIINLAFASICMGTLSSLSIIKKNEIPEKDKRLNEKYDASKAIDRIILFTFPVKVIIDVLCLIFSITRGGVYARAWMNAFPNVLIYYGKVSIVGFALKIMINKSNPEKQKRCFMFIILYILVMMISGIRSENVGYVLVLAFIYFSNKNTKIKKNILYIILSAIGIFIILNFIVTAGAFRNKSNKDIASFVELYKYYLTEKNVVFSLMDTCGDTGYTAQCVLNKWLTKYDVSYGKSYYLGMFAIIPNIPKILEYPGKITKVSCFALDMQEKNTLSSSYTNIGGSLIGELFFNFGIYGGVIFAFIIGIIAGIISRKSEFNMKEENIFGMIRYFPIMFAMVYWVRDYFGGGIREIIWGPIICFIIIKYFSPKKIREREQEI